MYFPPKTLKSGYGPGQAYFVFTRCYIMQMQKLFILRYMRSYAGTCRWLHASATYCSLCELVGWSRCNGRVRLKALAQFWLARDCCDLLPKREKRRETAS